MEWNNIQQKRNRTLYLSTCSSSQWWQVLANSQEQRLDFEKESSAYRMKRSATFERALCCRSKNSVKPHRSQVTVIKRRVWRLRIFETSPRTSRVSDVVYVVLSHRFCEITNEQTSPHTQTNPAKTSGCRANLSGSFSSVVSLAAIAGTDECATRLRIAL